MLDVPNLDGLKPAELEAAARALEKLALYARLRCRAAEMRRAGAGDLRKILALESKCEAIYRGLPEWARL